jgi:hypothetical protein
MKCFRRAICFIAALTGLVLCAHRQAHAEILLSSDFGIRFDALVDPNPILLFPPVRLLPDAKFVTLTVNDNPFNPPPFEGPVNFDVVCCKALLGGQPIAAPGLEVQVVPAPCSPLVAPGSANRCPATSGATANVAADVPAVAFLRVAADKNVAPGVFVATVSANAGGSPGLNVKQDLTIYVIGPWPADGPPPKCTTGLEIMKLASIQPSPFVWKAGHLATNSYSLGIAFGSAANSPGGLEVDLTSPATTSPITPIASFITFTNTQSRPVEVRTSNSANCSAAAQSFTVAPGATVRFSIIAPQTTTLVFSKSTCRAWVDLFNCWGGSALGMDDIVQFSEGPFWAFFGGRSAAITTVGDWSAMPRPNSTVVQGP